MTARLRFPSYFGAVALLAVLPLTGCATPPPSGPSVVAMPRQGESMNQFQTDDYACRDYAQNRTGNPAGQQAAQTNTAVGSAAIGTALGAGVGALLGSASGNAGAGAAIGAGAGLLGGAAVGSNNAAAIGESAQQRYDVAYAQCMTSKDYTIQGGPAPVAVDAPPVVYAAPYPYAYPLGFTPLFIAGPGWYHGHYYHYRGYYDPHGRFMRGYHPH
jgi:hypothetical protein